MSVLPDLLRAAGESLSVELRPPQAGMQGARSMDDWIDTYHAIRRLTVAGRPVFITDNAVGRLEEENLRHLVANLGGDAERSRIVPFLTAKHSLDYCLRYAQRAEGHGFHTLVVLGGDRHDGIARCVEHASELRHLIRARVPGLALGGWANPHANASQQAGFLERGEVHADFFLTQVVSHHSSAEVGRFLEELARRRIEIPGIFGVFYYRSNRPKTLAALGRFFPVPIEALQREFAEEGLDPDAVCARSIRALWSLGVRHVYVSNLPVAEAAARLDRIAVLARE
jgi:5,10-methylenetetrahydrofolate reductase